MPHPLLYRSQIHTTPQRPRCERCSELVQPKVVGVQLRALRDRLADIEKVQFGLAPSSWEQERTRKIALRFPSLQSVNELVRDGNLTAFVGFGREPVLTFIANIDDSTVEIDLGPRRMHHLLLPHAGHQKELEP